MTWLARLFRRCRPAVGVVLLLWAGACATPQRELQGLAGERPVDAVVFVTGGAFLQPYVGGIGTFGPGVEGDGEALSFASVLEVLERARVFQRLVVDGDPLRRRAVPRQLADRRAAADLVAVLQEARQAGCDYLLVVEELQDGPIEQLGTNGRWPVTFATWVLLGVGALIPDRTFESRATLHVTLRDLQSGSVMHDTLLGAGSIDLTLTERTDLLGLLTSIVVPPFWVGDDQEAVAEAVRSTTERRFLLSLARDLKSESLRQRLRARSPAAVQLRRRGGLVEVVVDARDGLAAVSLLAEGLAQDPQRRFAEALLASQQRVGERFQHAAVVPDLPDGTTFQVVVATVAGGVASATFRSGELP
ncbi:MAG: hypothetical protein U1F60_03410 [Planctomycetota bacterium]